MVAAGALWPLVECRVTVVIFIQTNDHRVYRHHYHQALAVSKFSLEISVLFLPTGASRVTGVLWDLAPLSLVMLLSLM